MSPAQIFLPQVGRTYRCHIDDGVFLGRVTGWDKDTVTVVADPNINEGAELPTDPIELKRSTTRFEEWL